MKKLLLILSIGLIFAGGVVLAHPNQAGAAIEPPCFGGANFNYLTGQPCAPTQCVNLIFDMQVGSTDSSTNSDVTRLQNFLISKSHGSFQATGYFGTITKGAVINFQNSQGLLADGSVGPITRGKIQSSTCGTDPQEISISSLSPTSGPVGTGVTVYGSGFTEGDTTVNFGGGVIQAIFESVPIGADRTFLSFIIPSYVSPCANIDNCEAPIRQITPGTYSVSVSNSRGISNSVNFDVTDGSRTDSPIITSVEPTSGSLGTRVTVRGSNFDSNNYLRLDGAVGPSSSSSDGRTLTFTLPQAFNHPSCDPFTETVCLQSIVVPTLGGHKLTVQNIHGTSNGADFTITSGVSSGGSSGIVNLSSRAQTLNGDNIAISGFTIGGSGTKKVLIRGLGSSIARSGLSNVLVDPTISLRNSSGSEIAANDDWQDEEEEKIQATELAPDDDSESAILVTLSPGSYTVLLSGNNIRNDNNIGLVEIYDIEGSAKLVNGSTRGRVDQGDNVIISGMIVRAINDQQQTFVFRGLGPSLSNFGLNGEVSDPTITLYDNSGTAIASNNDWGDSDNKSQILSLGLVPSDEKESAIIKALAPGAYTVILRGKEDVTGLGLVEIYAVGAQLSGATAIIDSIIPTSGPVGTQITLTGRNFTSNGITINFGEGVIPSATLNNAGTALSFQVPDSIGPACLYSTPSCDVASRQVTPGTYPISITSANGTSNAVNFTVTTATWGINPSQLPTASFSANGSKEVTANVGDVVNFRWSSSRADSWQFYYVCFYSATGGYCGEGNNWPVQGFNGTLNYRATNNNAGKSYSMVFTVVKGTELAQENVLLRVNQ